MSEPPTATRTRGSKVAIPPELRKRTLEQIREEKAVKEKALWEQRGRKEAEKKANHKKQAASQVRIAAFEDAQAVQAKDHYSLRPDLHMKDLPKPPLRQSSRYTPKMDPPAILSALEDIANGDLPADACAEVESSSADLPGSRPTSPSPFDIGDADIGDDEVARYDPSDLPPATLPPDTDSEGVMDVDNATDGDSSEGPLGATNVHNDDDDDDSSEWQPSSDVDMPAEKANKLTEAEREEWEAFRQWKHAQAKEQRKVIAKHERDLKAEKAKRAKQSIRASINASRQIVPAPVGKTAKSQKKSANKRKESETIEERQDPQKRSKASTEIGGLSKSWRSTSTRYHEEITEDNDTAFNYGGALEKEEGKEALAAARQAKGEKKSDIKREREVILQAADVKAIDTKEHEKKPVKPRTNWTNKDLPLASSDLHAWQHRFIPRIIDWGATLGDPFGSNNHPDFKPTVAKEWCLHFGKLPQTVELDGKTIKREEHPAIYHVAMSGMRTYRSEVGKYAITSIDNIWTQDDMKDYSTVELRRDWVADQLAGMRFLYEFPDAEQANGRNYGDPAGALALVCAAVRRVLTIWQGGFNSLSASTSTTTSKRSTKNSSDSFKDDPWGREAKTVYFPRTKELNQEKWDDIFYRCEQILKKRGIATKEQVSEAPVEIRIEKSSLERLGDTKEQKAKVVRMKEVFQATLKYPVLF
ncbi:uncharacterized protein EV420DRAFT_1691769 [Desarmillaria tabescens]|uniref:Uncharacterized protein n=1 Tax=Armillaria tabescens TaxID=1929756 RepID=A0AA39MH82_ARMTA|nr:uncharacterized protein EV420DRAFT_1691769 [Desarmillaria tabescens]KAK0433385.1 hypothetical protein EV420DRAFT_1691769 [Desarmillaria tabescens]